MRSLQSNLAYVRACLAELDDYEAAETLFWTLSSLPPAGTPAFLQMTLGNMVLALDELRALEAGVGPRERTEILQVQAAWEARWGGRSARLEAKAIRELDARLGQWRACVHEVLEGGHLSDYSDCVRPRLCAARLLQLLGTRHARTPVALAELGAIDAALDARMVNGPCVLGDEMTAVYPPESRYRFLYWKPRESPA